MNRLLKTSIVCIAITSALSGCSLKTSNSAIDNNDAVAVKKMTQAQLANQIFSNYFQEAIELSPVSGTYIGQSEYNDKFSAPISAESIAANKALEQTYLTKIEAIDESQLTGQDLLSYKIFKRDRLLAINSFKFNSHYLPLNQMYGIHNAFATLGSGQSAQPFVTKKDYQNFVKRSDGFALYMDSVIVSMRNGVSQGYVLPTPIIEKIIPQLSVHLVEDIKDSVFYGPINMLATNEELSVLISDVLIPTYRKFHAFIQNEYLPLGRASVGLSELPNGEEWYQHQIEVNTTLPLSAKEIHEFGLQEVARIRTEMTKVKQQLNFDGDLQAFFKYLIEDEKFYWKSEDEVVKAYSDVKDQINAKLPALFEVFPKADYEVRAVESFRAASSAGASYQSPAPDGSRPGIFYINTHNLKAQPKFLLETLSIHEASPGHHFQISIQQEVDSLPMFRKFGGYTVFSEGWALYAESLGKEMGMFTDPLQWYGRLSDEQLRAMRLVVDTGLHAFGWSREQAIQFMVDNSSLALSDITAEVERYISIPGQALAYKTGQRAIREMRNNAQQQLGDDFDVRKFHTQILTDGALPMPILAEKIQTWVDTQK